MTRRDGLPYAGSLSLDLISPVGDAGRLHPAVVFVHGGGFSGGDRAQGGQALTPLVRRGYVGVSIDYRIDVAAPPVTLPLDAGERARVLAAVSDVKAAVRWLRANAVRLGIDPDRIALMGSSAGAIAALTAALTSDSPGDRTDNAGFSSAVCTTVSVMGASDPALVGGDDAGALFVHGDADTTVPFAAARDTERAMRAAGLPTQFTTFPGRGHDLDVANQAIQTIIATWLRAHLARTTSPCL